METTITTSPLFTVSFVLLLVCLVATLAILLITMKKGAEWSERTSVRVMRAGLVLVLLAVPLMITTIVMVEREVKAAVDAMESEYGVTELTSISENTISNCSLGSSASAAEYTWVSAEGERERGIFAKSERQDGSCVYSLTPESAS